MKKLLLLMALVAASLASGAQKVYFMYIQSDNGTPFYVRLGEAVHSSTAAGYLILPKLKDSTYILQLGFAGQTAESRFPVAMNKEDKGFILKQVGGTWNLFDLQSLTLTKALAVSGPTEAENKELLASADVFTQLLVRASDDLSLLQSGPSAPQANMNNVAAAPAPKAENNVLEVKTPKEEPVTAAVMPARIKAPAEKAQPVAAVYTNEKITATHAIAQDTVPPAAPAEPVFAKSVVTRRSESSTTEGFGLVFIDRQGELSDTVRLLIPNPKESARAVVQAPPPVAEAAKTAVADPKTDTLTALKKEVVAAPSSDAAPVVVAAGPLASPDCKVQADDKDFLKLRKNMAAETDEGEMVTIARKNFKGRCYTTEQVRLLSTLFLTAIGKYNFFDAAKGHVSDAAQFASLSAELKDDYFSKRFQELVK